MGKINKVLLSTIALVGVIGTIGLTYATSGNTLKDFRGKLGIKSLMGSGSNFGSMMGKMGGKHSGCDKMLGMSGGKGIGEGFGIQEKLTDVEKEKLKSMTDDDKKIFFENKRKEFQAKREAKEIIIDKLLNGEILTDSDKKMVEEIKIERAETKKQRSEMEIKMKEQKVKMEEIQPLLEKAKKGETLTAEEKAKLYDTMTEMRGSGKGKKGN